jgi:DNA-binding PadR family transcriptional regulator
MTSATESVLRILLSEGSPLWGLRIIQKTGLASGTIYPMLARLEGYGWVAAEWDIESGPGPRRRLYSITDEGRLAAARALAERSARPGSFSAGVEVTP